MNTLRQLVLLASASTCLAAPFGLLQAAPKAAYRLPPLDPEKGKHHVPGKFVWGDLFSTDVEATTDFYTELFGWTAKSYGSGDASYTLLMNDGIPVAGIALNPAVKLGASNPKARWVGYISVSDIDEAAQRVLGAGGRVLVQPREIPDRGAISIIADTNHIILGMIESTYGDPPERSPDIGRWIWVQLVSTDTEAALPFYQNVFGFEEHEDDRTPIEGDYLLSTGGIARAGLTPATNEEIERGAWLGFVHCADAAQTATKAEALGATIVVPASKANESESVSVIVDPFGGIVGLYSIHSN